MHELLTQVQYASHDSILLVAHNDTLQVSGGAQRDCMPDCT